MTFLREKWLREAELWDEKGDPPYDPSLDPVLVRAELEDKAQVLAELEAEQETLWRVVFKETFGVEPETAGVGAGLTALAMLRLLVSRFGSRVLGLAELADALKEPGSGAASRKALKAAFRRLGVINILLALPEFVAIKVAWEAATRMRELHDQERRLRRAMRYEALTIDPDPAPADVTQDALLPPSLVEELERPECHLLMAFTIRWINRETGELEVREIEEARVEPDASGRYSRKIPIPREGCAAQVEFRIYKYCEGTPPVRELLYRAAVPYRTAGDCSRQRGRLVSDE